MSSAMPFLSFVSVSNWSYLFLYILTVVLFTTFSARLFHLSTILELKKLVPLGGPSHSFYMYRLMPCVGHQLASCSLLNSYFLMYIYNERDTIFLYMYICIVFIT